jgi:hypothetical protein
VRIAWCVDQFRLQDKDGDDVVNEAESKAILDAVMAPQKAAFAELLESHVANLPKKKHMKVIADAIEETNWKEKLPEKVRCVFHFAAKEDEENKTIHWETFKENQELELPELQALLRVYAKGLYDVRYVGSVHTLWAFLAELISAFVSEQIRVLRASAREARPPHQGAFAGTVAGCRRRPLCAHLRRRPSEHDTTPNRNFAVMLHIHWGAPLTPCITHCPDCLVYRYTSAHKVPRGCWLNASTADDAPGNSADLEASVSPCFVSSRCVSRGYWSSQPAAKHSRVSAGVKHVARSAA